MSRAVPAATTRASNAARLAGYLAAGVGTSVLATSNAEAAIVMIDLTSDGTNNQNITCVNAGMAHGQAKRTVLRFVPGGNLDIYFGNGDIGFDADDGIANQNLFRFATNDAIASPKDFASGSVIDGPDAAR